MVTLLVALDKHTGSHASARTLVAPIVLECAYMGRWIGPTQITIRRLRREVEHARAAIEVRAVLGELDGCR